jgi:hypothetical protein
VDDNYSSHGRKSNMPSVFGAENKYSTHNYCLTMVPYYVTLLKPLTAVTQGCDCLIILLLIELR